jgi:hypothetical protein
MVVLPLASAPKISDRCDTDLSPGQIIVPSRDADAFAVSCVMDDRFLYFRIFIIILLAGAFYPS